MSFCKKNLNPFQRRSMQLIGAMLASCVSVSVVFQMLFEHEHFSTVTFFGIALLSTVPIVGTMIVIARYLARETDEYLRSLVVRSILWAFGAVMVADTFLGYVVEYHAFRLPFGILNMDIFVATGTIVLGVQLRRNQ